MSTDEKSFEVQMHAFRLMRSGNYSTARSIKAELYRVFADMPREAVDAALSRLASRLIDEDGSKT